ncbi:MAG: DUF2267 domain-containing protein [Kofleriaceae bacterium]|nr:DUF2267 domain-containing protein [Kofleriaceae bacterium]
MDQLEPSVAKRADAEPERATQLLLADIERSGVLPEDVPALEAADAVLCALEMRLPRSQAEEVEHDAPPTLRMFLSRCVVHRTGKPEIEFDETAFLRLVASALSITYVAAERVTRAVFDSLQKLMPQNEVLEVRRRLPSDLRALWYPRDPSELAPPPPPPRADVIARPVEEPTESILREIEQSGVLTEGLSATLALGAVLCSLSFELTGHEAQELADRSRTLRNVLGACVTHRGERPEVMKRPTFLRQVADHLGIDESRADPITRTVFAAVRGRLPPDEIQQIDNRIPRSVRPLWKPE